MSRKIKFNTQELLDTAFCMTQEEGFLQVTARKLAAKANCSTQPIFRAYSGMPELMEALFEKCILYYQAYYLTYNKANKTPFIDLGMAYIEFAKTEKNIFQLLFLSTYRGERSLYEVLNGKDNFVALEINKAKQAGCKNASEVFMKMWIFIHGAACMSVTGDYDLSIEDTQVLLEEQYNACF